MWYLRIPQLEWSLNLDLLSSFRLLEGLWLFEWTKHFETKHCTALFKHLMSCDLMLLGCQILAKLNCRITLFAQKGIQFKTVHGLIKTDLATIKSSVKSLKHLTVGFCDSLDLYTWFARNHHSHAITVSASHLRVVMRCRTEMCVRHVTVLAAGIENC